jgi:hypothetical protein
MITPDPCHYCSRLNATPNRLSLRFHSPGRRTHPSLLTLILQKPQHMSTPLIPHPGQPGAARWRTRQPRHLKRETYSRSVTFSMLRTHWIPSVEVRMDTRSVEYHIRDSTWTKARRRHTSDDHQSQFDTPESSRRHYPQ